MGEYHDLNPRTDVLPLPDIFENFRNLCMTYYGCKRNIVSDVSEDVYKCYNDGKTVRGEKTSKLLLTLYDKDKHVIQIRNLKYYLEKGFVLKQIHRCIKLYQSELLKEWVDFNTEKGKEATNYFDKDFQVNE